MSYNNQNVRIGADIGGTFIDAVLEQRFIAKVLTNYSEPGQTMGARG